MTPAQMAGLVEALRAGTPLSWAARAAGSTVANLRALAEKDDDFGDLLERAECAGARARARAEAGEEDPPAESGGGPDPANIAPVWLAARAEAAELALGPFGLLLWLDGRLVKAGFPAMSAWWTATAGGFYRSGKRWLLVRVGRGGGKSTTLVRVAASDGLFGERSIPPGQRWVWPFISATTTDARRRIVELQAILGAVGVKVVVKYPQGLPTIELEDAAGQTISFVSIASTIAGVSGPSTIGATIDEEAKLRDRTANVNPATEILASLVQTFRARDGIRAIRCSSAWTNEGSHAEAIKEGDGLANHLARIGTPFLDVVQQGLEDVAQWEARRGDTAAANRVRTYARTVDASSPNVPTWLANPTITAIKSREEVEALPEKALDGVPRIAFWLRENASLPMSREAGRSSTDNRFEGVLDANQRLVAIGRASIFGGASGPHGGGSLAM